MGTITSMALIYFLVFVGGLHGQPHSFQVRARGIQVFNTHDAVGRNQVTFYSKAPLEDIFGAAADVSGKISFDPADPQRTMKGSIIVNARSMKTGLKKRDSDMLGEKWLDVYRYPTITFTMKNTKQATLVGENEMECLISGDFTLHGVTKTITIPVSLKYFEENSETLLRAPGDLLTLRSKFTINFEDYGIKPNNNMVGIRVAKSIDLTVSIVASNHVFPREDE